MAQRPSWLEAALQYHAAGRPAEAERICSDILRADPSEADALNLMGLIAAHGNRAGLAANLIQRAIALRPGRGDFHAALGNLYLAQGNEGPMTECYRRALLLTHFSAIPPPFSEIARYAGSAPSSMTYLAGYESYKSQCLQDAYLDRWVFAGMENGVFFDIGAHDGISLSNSYFFEKARGWRGICVEPNPSAFERLRASRHCTVLNCCVAATNGIAAFRKLSGHSEMLSGISENYHPEHRARIERELEKFGGTSETIPVEARTISGIVAEHTISEITYLSIDTEGGEFDILNSIPFGELPVHAVSVECNFDEERARMATLMDGHGFDLAIVLGHDLLFINRNSPWCAVHASARRD
jgi:FkbM family methyltransferase